MALGILTMHVGESWGGGGGGAFQSSPPRGVFDGREGTTGYGLPQHPLRPPLGANAHEARFAFNPLGVGPHSPPPKMGGGGGGGKGKKGGQTLQA